jgi:hypothetical protein
MDLITVYVTQVNTLIFRELLLRIRLIRRTTLQTATQLPRVPRVEESPIEIMRVVY